jgi:MFS family permease
MADVGSIAGGWIAGRFIKRGWSVNRARKTAMFICALAVTPIVFASGAHNLWLAVGLIGLATAGHQGWSANVFTLTSDMFPRHTVASVVGIGGLAGAVGGMMIATFTGFLLETTGSYVPVFTLAGSAYLLGLLVVHVLAPRLQPLASSESANEHDLKARRSAPAVCYQHRWLLERLAPIGSIERFDPALDAIVAPGAQVEKLAEGFDWAEGPSGFVRAATCCSPMSGQHAVSMVGARRCVDLPQAFRLRRPRPRGLA